jgi:hypothetical protein
MSKLTKEQSAYINYDGVSDIKLIATAGSGKTFCIIKRIDRLLSLDRYENDELLMLTFSRFTRDDFLHKIIKYDALHIAKTSVKTIDSFAKSIIDDNNDIDVSLLSYKFMKMLEETTPDKLKTIQKLNTLKIIFVDEAQDLNEIQFKICILLKYKLDIILNFIGDPNQNIYQFRASSDKYFREFNAKTFYLTRNFRSCPSIVNFSKHLRPVADVDVKHTKPDNGIKPIVLFHENETDFEKMFVEIIRHAIEREVDLSDIAVLSAVRGKMRGYSKSHGLCLISNILYKAGIKFKQFYEDSTDEVMAGAEYKPKKGHINLLTMMGSKGLEWKFVIIIDADNCLINKRAFNVDKHKNDRYLLYVACSRAIENMVIFSRYGERQGIIDYKFNKWFDEIPKSCYKIDAMHEDVFKFQEIRSYDMGSNEKRISKIIDKMSEVTLDRLSTICKYGCGSTIIEQATKITQQVYSNKPPDVEIKNPVFFTKYIKNLFHSVYCIKHNLPKNKYTDVENITDSQNIVTDVPSVVTEWFFSNRTTLSWELFDEQKDILDPYLVEVVETKFNRACELKDHTIVNDGYFKSFILSNRLIISENYKKYITCNNTVKLRKYLFNIVLLLHALDTQHYFYVANKGKKFKHILKDYAMIFNELDMYVYQTDMIMSDSNVAVMKMDFVGMVDFVEQTDESNVLWEMKCSTEITLKNVLQLLMYNIMYDNMILTTLDTSNIQLNFLNLLKGTTTCITLSLSHEDILEILQIFVKTKESLTLQPQSTQQIQKKQTNQKN